MENSPLGIHTIPGWGLGSRCGPVTTVGAHVELSAEGAANIPTCGGDAGLVFAHDNVRRLSGIRSGANTRRLSAGMRNKGWDSAIRRGGKARSCIFKGVNAESFLFRARAES